MSTAAAAAGASPDPGTGEVETVSPLRAFALHLWAFFLPVLTFVFLATGPHPWWQALLWIVPIWVLVWVDVRSPKDHRQPAEGTPAWPFDLQVYGLVALQITNHVMLGVMASKLAVWPAANLGETVANFFAMNAVSGVCAGYSGIVVAHELIHRRNRFQFFLGRLLLMFVCYEHFATEHVRGHHPRVGTLRDPATARFGETFRQFFWRTVPAQFRSAWELEKVRNQLHDTPWYSPRWLRHRVLQGVAAEVLIVAGFVFFFGWLAAFFFVMQARMAIMLLEVVNYIEHWGLLRQGKTVTNLDSWDTDHWFTLYTLVGLSRHSDHHARASRPYQMLRHFDESPKMPSGYYGTIVLALMRNEDFRKIATLELKRRKLGPFREDGETPGAAPPPGSERAPATGAAVPQPA
jgi:alkane 1-monooxygenase